MKKLLIILAGFICISAYAGTTCQQSGEFTICTDSDGSRTICQTSGEFTTCNKDGI